MLHILSFRIPLVNLTSDPDTTPVIALFNKRTPWSDDSNFWKSHTCLQINFWTMKTSYLFVHILATYHCGRRCSRMRGGQGLSVSEVNLTSEPGPSMNSVFLRWAPSLNICSKLKGQPKTIKFGSDISLVSSLPLHSCSLKTFLVTLSL